MGATQAQVVVPAKPPESAVTRIEARRRWLALDLAELWEYRDPVYLRRA